MYTPTITTIHTHGGCDFDFITWLRARVLTCDLVAATLVQHILGPAPVAVIDLVRHLHVKLLGLVMRLFILSQV